MRSVARSRKFVQDKECGGFWPEAGCFPAEDEVPTHDADLRELARSQQDVTNDPG